MRLSTADCICISGFWRLHSQTPTGALPLDSAGGLPSPRLAVLTLPSNPGYATGLRFSICLSCCSKFKPQIASSIDGQPKDDLPHYLHKCFFVTVQLTPPNMEWMVNTYVFDFPYSSQLCNSKPPIANLDVFCPIKNWGGSPKPSRATYISNNFPDLHWWISES